ncbi:hypothetical protein A2U01_0090018, partial [Trifolium medium]|nr:hypothetical protein [Trifolium medium]
SSSLKPKRTYSTRRLKWQMLYVMLDQKTTIPLGNHIAKVATEGRTTNIGSPGDHPACSRATLPLPPRASTS